MTDWRLPEHRREIFQRFYTFQLTYGTHPGCVYFLLPALAETYSLDVAQRGWLTWLNGNTQNPVMSLLLLDAAPTAHDWRKAVEFWNTHYSSLEWDTDRRYQKSKFAAATEAWYVEHGDDPARGWTDAGSEGWAATWKFATSLPFMGRLSAWSMIEYARLLLGLDAIPDSDTLLLHEKEGSRSHRNGLGVIAGHDAVYWKATDATPDRVEELTALGESLIAEARTRNPDLAHVGYLTMESTLCTYKSWHKPNRRYPNVYADMLHDRLRRAEARFGYRFDVLWQARRDTLPTYLRLEDSPLDPGLAPVKQNHYRLTGQPIMMHRMWDDLANDFNLAVDEGRFGVRKGYRPWTPAS